VLVANLFVKVLRTGDSGITFSGRWFESSCHLWQLFN